MKDATVCPRGTKQVGEKCVLNKHVYLSNFDKRLLLEYLRKGYERPVVKELYKIIEDSNSILVR
jgi:hypothetical protein